MITKKESKSKGISSKLDVLFTMIKEHDKRQEEYNDKLERLNEKLDLNTIVEKAVKTIIPKTLNEFGLVKGRVVSLKK